MARLSKPCSKQCFEVYLAAALGSLARRSRDTFSFLKGMTSSLVAACKADGAILFLFDNISLPTSVVDGHHRVRTTPELVPVAKAGDISLELKPVRGRHITASSLSSDSNVVLNELMGTRMRPPGRFFVLYPMRSPNGLLGALVVCYNEGRRKEEGEIHRAIIRSLTEASMMIRIVADRDLQRQLVEFNQVGGNTDEIVSTTFASTLLLRVRSWLQCDGISFLCRETAFPEKDIQAFSLIATVPRKMPDAPVRYAMKDGTVTSKVLALARPCIIHYVEKRRHEMRGMTKPKWRDLPDDQDSGSVIYVPIKNEYEVYGMLRCSRRLCATGTRYFSALDLRGLEAFASAFALVLFTAEKEHRVARSWLTISHEISTSAAGIKSCANFIRRQILRSERNIDIENDERLFKLGHIMKSVDGLALMLEPLQLDVDDKSGVDLIRPGARERIAGFAPYADLCKPICEAYYQRAKERGINIKITGNDQLGRLYGELSDFEHIFRNLVSNAVKYTSSGETIIVGLERPRFRGEYARIHVVSKSLPIREDEKDAIFEFRYRSAAAEARSIEGDGLGLAIARNLARQLHGDVVFAAHGEYNMFSILIAAEWFRNDSGRRNVVLGKADT